MKPATYLTLLFWVAFLTADSLGRVLEVPADYSTIQIALDSSQTSDTIRVAPGVYHEFLLAPSHSLTLTGWYPGDTLAVLRSTLDPIPSGVDTPSAAVFGGDSVAIRNFAFFNRHEYRQYGAATRTGGVRFMGTALSLENCRFDSVSRGVRGGARLYLRNCIFEGCYRDCVTPSVYGMVDCRDCSFDGEGPHLLKCYSNSVVRNCTFLCNRQQSEFLIILGSSITVSGCRFGPCYSAFPVLSLYSQGNCLIENCAFEGIERAYSLIDGSVDCDEMFEHAPITIFNNEFVDFHGVGPASGTTAIQISCQGSTNENIAHIESNSFQNGSSTIGPGVRSNLRVSLANNQFADLFPENLGDVWLFGSVSGITLARDNMFLPPGLAAQTDGMPFDARENWWGDSTGPYHSVFNPEGRGTEVGNGVEFIPWLTAPPDSIPDTSGTSADERNELPSELLLSVFPNPFNPTTTISFSLWKSEIVRLELFDILGRRIATLADDLFTAGLHEVHFDGSKYASGVYFAKLTTSHAPQAAKLLLLK
ncbi:T9SS type A sorting domain-containing protein [bacterium]|nr:T9SS type A sorting domain-containing protein [bacterium]